ncbi:MAG: hypothetical protein PCFJNLEI_01587 [Verrucomicrobiae bacterium]|nr:hypothetical protein [Verrucomicrobiae bacterium]
MLISLLLLCGCREPVAPLPPVAPAPASVSAAQTRLDELTAAIKVGMTEDEVVRAVGEASRTKSRISGAITTVAWEYDLGDGRRYRIWFDRENRVTSARLDSPMIDQ